MFVIVIVEKNKREQQKNRFYFIFSTLKKSQETTAPESVENQYEQFSTVTEKITTPPTRFFLYSPV